MKRVLVFLMILLCITPMAFAKEVKEVKKDSGLDYEGMRFGLGALVAMESPVLMGNEKGMEVGDKFKDVQVDLTINDFVFGVPMQFDWMWEDKSKMGVGIKLDLDVAYVPTVDYESVFNDVKNQVSGLTGGVSAEAQTAHYENMLRAELAPMFAAKFAFFKLGIGPSLIMDMNCNQLDDARKAAAGTPNEGKTLAHSMKRIGLDEKRTVESLNGWESIAFYGLNMDLALRTTLDFEIGDHFVLGGLFKIRFNSQMQKWEKGADTKTNFANVFDPQKFAGFVGFRVLYMF